MSSYGLGADLGYSLVRDNGDPDTYDGFDYVVYEYNKADWREMTYRPCLKGNGLR
jgi:hypothetical protein